MQKVKNKLYLFYEAGCECIDNNSSIFYKKIYSNRNRFYNINFFNNYEF